MLIKYEELYDIAKSKLSKERFNHTIGVVNRAIEYAKIYKVDEEIVKITALAHDIAKELSKEEEQEIINKYNIKLDEIELINHSLLHAIIGSYICQNEYGFNDDMTNAVRYHTTGRSNMSILEKIIYLADATEEGREFLKQEYVDLIKTNIDLGMIEVLKDTIDKLASLKKVIHLDTITCYNYYVIKKGK